MQSTGMKALWPYNKDTVDRDVILPQNMKLGKADFQLREWGGGVAQGLGISLFAFGGAYWPLTNAHSDPLWARTCFGCVNGAPG